MRVGVLVSGAGSNLQALLDSERAGTLGASIVVVIANHPGIAALDRSLSAGVPVVLIERESFPTRKEQHLAIGEALADHHVDLVVTAGFDRILHPNVVARFPNRIINIHPSLLPAFGGGLHAIGDALAHGVKVSGCTVHLVIDEVDAGPIVAQQAVPVLEDDDEATLARRIHAAEHRTLPAAVRLFADGRVEVVGRRVRILDH